MTGNGIAWCVSPGGGPGLSWNPVVGCSAISPGCAKCWAAGMASRGLTADHKGLAEHGRWIAGPKFLPGRLAAPLRRRKPTGYAVALMGDLFHKSVTNQQIAAVYCVAAACPQHRFYSLTKRAERLPEWWAWFRDALSRGVSSPLGHLSDVLEAIVGSDDHPALDAMERNADTVNALLTKPLPNWWQGVSVENQATADDRIPHLLRCPAAVRWVSMEPQLEAVDLDLPRCETHDRRVVRRGPGGDFCGECAASGYSGELSRGHWLDDIDEDTGKPANGPGLSWVVQGGESGPGARPFDLAWARATRDACKAAAVPYFCKQLGAHPIDGIDSGSPPPGLPPGDFRPRNPGAWSAPELWPADLRDCRTHPADMVPKLRDLRRAVKAR